MVPLEPCDAELPPCTKTALELVNGIRAKKTVGEATVRRFAELSFVENQAD